MHDLDAVADPGRYPRSWHRVAEHVLAAAQFADAGTIRLRAFPGGSRPRPASRGRQLAVVGDDARRPDGNARGRTPLQHPRRAAAEFAGVAPGCAAATARPPRPTRTRRCAVTPPAAQVLAHWFALGDAALRRFAVDARPPAGAGALARALRSRHHRGRGQLRLSPPATTAIAEPYLYVARTRDRRRRTASGTHRSAPRCTADRIHTPDDAVDFFAAKGRALTERSRT